MAILRTAATAVAIIFPIAAHSAIGSDAEVAFELRDVLEAGSGYSSGDNGHLYRFYSVRQGATAWWVGRDWSPAAEAAVERLARSDDHGLVPADYGASKLQDAVGGGAAPASPRKIAETEVMLTRAVLHYLEDVANGRIDPSTVDWNVNRTRRIDPPSALQRGLLESDFASWIDNVGPSSERYRRLREARARYAELAGVEWPVIAGGPTLRPGDRDPRIAVARRQLRLLERLRSGDSPMAARPAESRREAALSGAGFSRISYGAENVETVSEGRRSGSADSDYYDRELESALRDFQERQGILADGLLGPQTRAALNVSPAERLEEIDLNLERLRWFSDNPGDRYVMVNVPSYELTAYDGGIAVERIKVIVGEPDWKTPIFSDHVVDLKFAPDWTIPVSIAEEETLPKERRDPGYLRRNNIRVYGRGGGEVNPASVSWHSASSSSYVFRQAPGPGNALGLVRFSLTNSMGIYLHDTPTKGLFDRSLRALSHGCVRVERPVDFAEYLLAYDPAWGRERIEKAMRSSSTNVHHLEAPTPIHIVYFTASVDEQGGVEFRNDIYERNGQLRRALERKRSERQSLI